MQKWEYLVLSVGVVSGGVEWSDSAGRKGRLGRDWDASVAALLNDLGLQGWELIGVTTPGGPSKFYFKRPDRKGGD